MLGIDKEHFIEICNNSCSMAEACSELNMHFNTFSRYAKKFGCYKPNQSGKGLKKKKKSKILTKDILDGKYPQYQTYKLKLRLLDEGILEDRCCKCGWCGKIDGAKYSTCELHHIDGDNTNHHLDNLELICPNCHSITSNYRARNKRALR